MLLSVSPGLSEQVHSPENGLAVKLLIELVANTVIHLLLGIMFCIIRTF